MYLHRILQYGPDQANHLNDYPDYDRCDRVYLRRTRPYRFRIPGDLALLFEEVASLVLYLRSGSARTGYLFNWSGNPLHALVTSLTWSY